MNQPFENYRLYFLGLCRVIVFGVVLVALLFVAYCLIRLIGKAFTWVNAHWFNDHDGLWLITTAAALMAAGLVWQAIRRPRIPPQQVPRVLQHPRDGGLELPEFPSIHFDEEEEEYDEVSD